MASVTKFLNVDLLRLTRVEVYRKHSYLCVNLRLSTCKYGELRVSTIKMVRLNQVTSTVNYILLRVNT